MTVGIALGKLALGTVQFGLPYGVTNERGRVPASEAESIVGAALAAGIDLFDTAGAYGDSEDVLGRALGSRPEVRIVSKLAPVAAEHIGDAAVASCRAALERSLARLRRPSLYGLLLHRPDDMRKPGAERLAALLEEMKHAGVVARIGISAYDLTQIDAARGRFPLDVLQVPINLLDQRLLRNGTLARLKDANIEIHARSVFLQGALLADSARLPTHFAPHANRLQAVGEAARQAGLSRLALCLRFVLAQPLVDRVVVGVTSLAELRQVIEAAAETPELPDDLAALAADDPGLLDPSRWPPASVT